MTINDKLYEKLSTEYDFFIDDLKTKTPDEIIYYAYEKASKEDILMCFEIDDIHEEDAALLFALKSPLDTLYQDWLNIEDSRMDELRDSIRGTIEQLLGDNIEPNKAQAINGKIACFDVVISTGDSDYPFLVGEVNAVDKLGSEEHHTGNPTDDVFVDFRSEEYSYNRIKEIEEHFKKLYGEPKKFEDLSLDNVIMSPNSLIVVPESDIPQLLESREAAEAYCNRILSSIQNEEQTQKNPLPTLSVSNGMLVANYDEPRSEDYAELHAELMDRIEKNYADYQISLLDFGKQEIIGMASKIKAISDAYLYMTCWHGFDEDELGYFLEFQNPLEVLADEWNSRQIDLSDMGLTMEYVYKHSDTLLEQYPVMCDLDASKDTNLRRFMGVDVLEFLGAIADKTIVHYPNDWQVDRETLYNAALSDNVNERRLVWHVCSYGTHTKPEGDVFIKDSGAYGCMTDYRQNDPDMFGYIIEVTGRGEKGTVTGNVFEVGNYAEYANHICEVAQPLDSGALTYSDDRGINAGKMIVVSREEYDRDRQRLMSESGNVVNLQWLPPDEMLLAATLSAERSRRMTYPVGSQQAHLKKLSEKLAEIRKPTESQKKQSIEERLKAGKQKSDEYRAKSPVHTTKNEKEI